MTAFNSSFSFQALILVLLLARLSMQTSGTLVDDVCSKMKNPPFCMNLLKSDPRAGSADIKGLAKIVIGKAKSNATEILNLIKSLIPKAKTPQLKEAYSSCSDHYDNAIYDMDEAEEHLRKGDSMGVNVAASAAQTEADDCDEELKGLVLNPTLRKGHKNLNDICAILLVISNLLPRGH